MLRAIRWQERAAASAAFAALFKRCVRPACAALTLFLLMHAEIMPDYTPFAAAFFAAGLSAGASPAALVLGCLLGTLRLPLREVSMISAVSCAGVLTGEIVFSIVPKLRIAAAETRVSLVAGFGALLPALAFAAGDALQSLRALGCAALAAACAPFFLPAAELHLNRKRLSVQEKIGAVLLIAACLAGTQALFEPLSRSLALLLLLLLSGMGAGGGVIWGVALWGSGWTTIASMACCGLISGLKIYRHRWQRALALTASYVLALFLGANGSPLEAISASIFYLLLRKDVIARFEALSGEPIPDFNPEQISRDATDEAARRLRALGDAFAEMAEGCAASCDVPDEQTLLLKMRERLCSGCGAYEECWSGGDNGSIRFFCRLIEEAIGETGGRPLYSDGGVPPDVLRFCRRGKMIPDRLGLLLRDFAEKRRSEIKRCATGRLLSVQLAQAREILYDLAEKQSKPLYGRRTDALRAALDAAALEGVEVSAFGSVLAEVQLRKGDGWTKAEAKRAREAVQRSFGGSFAMELHGTLLRFAPKPRFEAESGSACQSGVAGQPCGDSHLLERMNGNRLAVMLSDGMGSGEAAAGESSETLRLLWRFLDAGISRRLALETVNQQMLMRSGEDIFATVDLCLIDLNSGIAEFSKLAACRTLLLRDGEVLRIEGDHLPLGILERVQSDVRRVRLKDGDMLVMGSDGVMELGDGLAIDRIARLSAALPPQQLAEKLVREAALRRSRGRADDMTCICLRICDAKRRPNALLSAAAK